MNSTHPKNVLITGGAGFIGTNLVEYLLKKGGYRLLILDNLTTGRKAYLDRILHSTNPKNSTNSSVELIEGDIRDPKLLERIFSGTHQEPRAKNQGPKGDSGLRTQDSGRPQAVVHLAAKTRVVDSLNEPEEVFQVNVMGTLNLLEACRRHGMKRFVFASSNAVVGEQDPPINERMVPAPISPYGASKLAGEALCSAYFGSFGIQAIALRFANVYGPYSDHKTSVVSKFIRRTRAGKPLIIYGDGAQTRDFIHARDIARAIDLALGYEPQASDHGLWTDDYGLVFQVATGVEIKIIDLANMIRQLAADSGFNPPEPIFEEARRGEIRRNFADISRAKELLGFGPEIELAEGLTRTWERSYEDL